MEAIRDLAMMMSLDFTPRAIIKGYICLIFLYFYFMSAALDGMIYFYFKVN